MVFKQSVGLVTAMLPHTLWNKQQHVLLWQSRTKDGTATHFRASACRICKSSMRLLYLSSRMRNSCSTVNLRPWSGHSKSMASVGIPSWTAACFSSTGGHSSLSSSAHPEKEMVVRKRATIPYALKPQASTCAFPACSSAEKSPVTNQLSPTVSSCINNEFADSNKCLLCNQRKRMHTSITKWVVCWQLWHCIGRSHDVLCSWEVHVFNGSDRYGI